MDEEQMKILEMVANQTITPAQAAEMLKEVETDDYYDINPPQDYIFSTEEQAYNNEESIDVALDLGVTDFKLSKGPNKKLFKIKYSKGEYFSHKVIFLNKELQIKNFIKPMSFDLKSLRKFVDPFNKKCTVQLSSKVKLYMKVKFGGGKAVFDFTDLKLKRLRLTSGASDTKLCFNKFNKEVLDYLKIDSGATNLSILGLTNANCSEIDLNLAASNAIIDFSGNLKREMFCEVNIRVGRLSILVPKEFAVKIQTNDKLANLYLRDFYLKDGYRVSSNIDQVDKIINLRINTTLAQVNFSWI